MLVKLQVRNRQQRRAGEDGAVGVDVVCVFGAFQDVGRDRTAVDRTGRQVRIGPVDTGGRAHHVDGERRRARFGWGEDGGFHYARGIAVNVDDDAVAVGDLSGRVGVELIVVELIVGFGSADLAVG